MNITPIGLILIPLSLGIFVARPQLLVPWAIVVSAFQAASVFNIGGSFPVGVSPYFFVTILITFRFLPLWLSGRLGFGGTEPILSYIRPLCLLVIWGTASAFLLPVVFRGVGVDQPRGGMDLGFTTPLSWTFSNAAQAGYLVLNSIFVVYMTWLAAESNYTTSFVRAFFWSGVIAASVGVYQTLSHLTGLPYPKEFFNSNLVWSQLISQNIAGMWRMSATFTEPSAAGGFFAVWSTFLLFLATDGSKNRSLSWLLLWIGMTMLVLSTSTTGYITAAVVFVLFVWKQLARIATRGTVNPRVILAGVLICGAFMVALAFIPDFGRLFEGVITQKAGSTSSGHRFATSWNALGIVEASRGLGVGLGSNRPSGMLFYIVSNLGIPGFALFFYLVYVTRRLSIRALHAGSVKYLDGSYLVAAGWAFAIELVTMCASGADVTSPLLWISWGMVVSLIRHVWMLSEDAEQDLITETAAWREAASY
jgi:hypothetical protein